MNEVAKTVTVTSEVPLASSRLAKDQRHWLHSNDYVGSAEIYIMKNEIKFVFDGEIKAKDLNTAIRMLPTRYSMWRKETLKERIKKGE